MCFAQRCMFGCGLEVESACYEGMGCRMYALHLCMDIGTIILFEKTLGYYASVD